LGRSKDKNNLLSLLFACEAIFTPRTALLVARIVRGRFKTGEIPFGRLDRANELGFVHSARLYTKFFCFLFQVGYVQHEKLLPQYVLKGESDVVYKYSKK